MLEGKVSCSFNWWPPDVLNYVPQCLCCCSLVLWEIVLFLFFIILGVFRRREEMQAAQPGNLGHPHRGSARFCTLANSWIRSVQPSISKDVVVFVKTLLSSSYVQRFLRTEERGIVRPSASPDGHCRRGVVLSSGHTGAPPPCACQTSRLVAVLW